MSEIYLPARCTGTLPDDFKEHHVAEEKMDGSRYVLYLGDDIDPYGRQDGHTLLSRRVSTVDNMHVDRTLQVPHITDQLYMLELAGTILDGEIFRDDFQTTTSIMGCAPSLAISKQESGWYDRKKETEYAPGWVTFHAWDVMQFRGRDVRGLPLSDRRKILEVVIDRLNNPYIKAVEQIKCDFEKHFTEITAKGGEGLIIKDSRLGYGIGWAKMKKAYDVTCVISGFTIGSGKYTRMIGAMELSVAHEGGYVCIGKASGFDDATRQDMSENPDNYLWRAVDINTMRLNKPSKDHPHGRLFQPTFHRFRDDVTLKEVTLEKLKKDLTVKPKSNRNKFGR